MVKLIIIHNKIDTDTCKDCGPFEKLRAIQHKLFICFRCFCFMQFSFVSRTLNILALQLHSVTNASLHISNYTFIRAIKEKKTWTYFLSCRQNRQCCMHFAYKLQRQIQNNPFVGHIFHFYFYSHFYIRIYNIFYFSIFLFTFAFNCLILIFFIISLNADIVYSGLRFLPIDQIAWK